MRHGVIEVPALPQTLWILWSVLGVSFSLGMLAPVSVLQSGAKFFLDILWLVLLVYVMRFYRDALVGLWAFVAWVGMFLFLTVLVQWVQ